MWQRWLQSLNRVNAKQRVFLVRQLAIMLTSGIPLAQALTLAEQQSSNDVLRITLRTMINDIERGESFSVSAARFPHVFDDIALTMFRSGEASGHLQEAMLQLATRLERNLEFQNRVRNALLYPVFVIAVMIIVGIIMATVIIPRLSAVFEDTAITLPWSTQAIIAISNSLVLYWYVYLAGFLIIAAVLRSLISTPEGKFTFYQLEMRLPILRDLAMNSYLVQFTSMLAMLIHSGVSIIEALRITSLSMPNVVWNQALEQVRKEVERGVPLSAAMGRHSFIPKQLTQMIAVGEQTGKLDSVLDTMAHYYEDQTNASLKSVTALLEPVVLLIVAVAVGFVVISVILPIYGLADQL